MVDLDELIEELNVQMYRFDVDFHYKKGNDNTSCYLSFFNYPKFTEENTYLYLQVHVGFNSVGYIARLGFTKIEDMKIAEKYLKLFRENINPRGRMLDYQIINNSQCEAFIVEDGLNVDDAYEFAKKISDAFQSLIHCDYIQKIDIWNK